MHNREMVPKWIKNLASSLFVSFVYHLHICKFLMSPPMSKMSPSPPKCPPPEGGVDNFEFPPPSHCPDPCGKPCVIISNPVIFLTIFNFTPITCHNITVRDLESHTKATKCCFGRWQSHMQCFL